MLRTWCIEVAIDDVQQYLQPDCLEIVGIPLVPQDNPKQFVQEVGSLLDVDIGVNDISTAQCLIRKRLKTELLSSLCNMTGKKRCTGIVGNW